MAGGATRDEPGRRLLAGTATRQTGLMVAAWRRRWSRSRRLEWICPRFFGPGSHHGCIESLTGPLLASLLASVSFGPDDYKIASLLASVSFGPDDYKIVWVRSLT